MNIRELQIGDWVYEGESTQFPMFVTGIFKDSDGSGGEVYLDFEGNEGDVWEVNIEDVRPIPITAEFLTKNGFEKSDYPNEDGYATYERDFNDYAVLINIAPKRNWFCEVSGVRFRDGGFYLQHIHQLQNAMRLCGIEWEVKI